MHVPLRTELSLGGGENGDDNLDAYRTLGSLTFSACSFLCSCGSVAAFSAGTDGEVLLEGFVNKKSEADLYVEAVQLILAFHQKQATKQTPEPRAGTLLQRACLPKCTFHFLQLGEQSSKVLQISLSCTETSKLLNIHIQHGIYKNNTNQARCKIQLSRGP